jgi:hypothetical protein
MKSNNSDTFVAQDTKERDTSIDATSQDSDEIALARLGYKSEMLREFGK